MDDGAHHATRSYNQPDHPGSLLRDLVLSSVSLSVSQAARDLAVTRQTLHPILDGDAAITPEMAAPLERFCGVPSEFWLACQQRYELKRVKKELALVLARSPSRPLHETIIEKIGAAHGR